MSEHTIGRIADLLTEKYRGFIDMSDYADRPSQERQAFLSRAVAAQCLSHLSDQEPAKAAKHVTDGFHDGGIDALFFDQLTDTFYFITSKWSDGGKNAFDADAARAFVEGSRKILSQELNDFNAKFKAKEGEILVGLRSPRHVRHVFAAAHVANAPIDRHVKDIIDNHVLELNNAVETARSEYFEQASTYSIVTAPPKINLVVQLRHFGWVDAPHKAFYGHVDTADVANWWDDHGDNLCFKNLRHYMRNSTINDRLRQTLKSDPEKFWYFNNGITIICDFVVKQPIGGAKTDVGIFTCNGISVVNGAQTVGTIGTVLGKKGSRAPANSWIQVRIISLEGAPIGLSEEITRATNFQNSVTNRDFAAMDPLQLQLAREFVLKRRTYAFKSGEMDPQGDQGCSITEATIALACDKSVSLTVLAKSGIGKLWDNTATPPYTDLFNQNINADHVWQRVIVMRSVDKAIEALGARSDEPRSELIATHLNRIILHLVFLDTEVKQFIHPNTDEKKLKEAAEKSASTIFPKVSAYLDQVHKGEYLAHLAKNFTKCEDLVRSLARTQTESEAEKVHDTASTPKAEMKEPEKGRKKRK